MQSILSLFKKRENQPRIEILSRYCMHSQISSEKKRMKQFSKEACFFNLIDTMDRDFVNLTCFLDTHYGDPKEHFLFQQKQFPVITINEGTEGGSFLRVLDYIERKRFEKNTILYFLEDDYLHRPGWIDLLVEGFSLPDVEYITLYDHRDKYYLPFYAQLESKLYISKSSHWRSIPSTTQTFATRVKTLKRDKKIHRKYSENRLQTEDHKKFCALNTKLISPLPGWSTPAELEYSSPCYDWESHLAIYAQRKSRI